MPVISAEERVAGTKSAKYKNRSVNPQSPFATEVSNGKYAWSCGSSATGCDVREVVQPWTTSDFQKKKMRNVPYLPSIHNRVPLPYFIKNEVEVEPVMDGSLSYQLVSPGAPIRCPAFEVGKVTIAGNSSLAFNKDYLPVSTPMRNSAIANLHDKLQEKKAITVNWGVFIGERRDTISMITKNLRDLVQVYSKLRKGKVKSAYSQLFGNKKRTTFDPLHQQWRYKGKRDKRTLDKLWLEWSFGWSPLIGDIYNAYQDLFGARPPLVFRVKGAAGDTVTQTIPVTHWFVPGQGGPPALGAQLLVTVEKYTKVVYRQTFQAENTLFTDLTSTGLLSPAEVAWELVPFSFIADYVANIGDVLRGLTINNGLKFLYGTVSTKQRVDVTNIELLNPSIEGSNNFGAFLASFDASSVVYKLHKERFERVVLGAPATLSFSFNHEMYSLRRAANLAALFSTFMRK